MEKTKIKIKKEPVKLPELSERFLNDYRSEIWNSGKIYKSNRNTPERNPTLKNYFLPTENRFESPIHIKTQESRISKPRYRVNEKKLQELEVELDNQEIVNQDNNEFNLAKIESLFFSYTSYLDGLISCISEQTYLYKAHLVRAKNGFISVFRALVPKLRKIYSSHHEKSCQTLMTINPSKHSVILSKLGDIINAEVSNTDKIEKYIQKAFVDSKRKSKIFTIGTQTDYKLNEDGVIEYEFKSYGQLLSELKAIQKQNAILMQEKEVLNHNYKDLDDIDKLVNRNKLLESMIIEMRNSINS